MDDAARRFPGQSILERVAKRFAARPRIGPSAKFYARFGLDDPWATPSTWQGWDAEDPFTYVAGGHFFARLRR